MSCLNFNVVIVKGAEWLLNSAEFCVTLLDV